jgi:NADPH:quinone reductase-like Zn-dependent oxidoreductase
LHACTFTPIAARRNVGGMTKTKTYRATMLTRAGGPEVLENVELSIPEPGPGELRVRVRATGVGSTDVTMRRGYYPYAPSKPFVLGYESVGTVDAIGPGVAGFAVGDHVCALLVHGGYAEYVVRAAS